MWQYNKTADKNLKCYNQEKQANDQLKSYLNAIIYVYQLTVAVSMMK